MSFAKPETKQSSQDDYSRLLCTFPGCNAIWTVQIDRPLCSFHQWGTNAKPKTQIHSVLKTPPVQHWNDKDDEGVF